MRIVFLLPVPSQARFHRRIEGLRALGVAPTVLAFEREYYSGEPWPEGYESLGHVNHGRYTRRTRPLVSALGKIRPHIEASDAVYAFGPDMMTLAVAVSTSRVRPVRVYEVGDIRDVMVQPGLLSTLLRQGEKVLVRAADTVVVTSKRYVTDYYEQMLGMTPAKFQVVENKLALDLTRDANDDAKNDRPTPRLPLRIGYFGLLRCEWSWKVLTQAARLADGRLQVVFRGLALVPPHLVEAARRSEHVEIHATYRSPADLPALYRDIDLAWVGYSGPWHQNNWRWKRTNRFYEAAAFGRPMLGSEGTEDAKAISALGIGQSFRPETVDESAAAVAAIAPTDVERWRDRSRGLAREVYLLDREHPQLLERIRNATRA